MIGKIERISLREVWKNESRDFTPWLEKEYKVLEDIIPGLHLINAEREREAGSFSVDLVAEDTNGNIVVIENQLEKSDHDHLGKLITYLVAMEAKTAIWIVSDPRPEHLQAIAWLNESSSASFYLLKVEAIRIGDSPPAPLLTLIVGPSEEGRMVGEKKRELTVDSQLRYQFWEEFINNNQNNKSLPPGIATSYSNWIRSSADIKGFRFYYGIRKKDSWVYLYIDLGKDRKEENKAIFDKLFVQKEEIEKQFGNQLTWARQDQNRACLISKVVSRTGYLNRERWPKVHDELIETMDRFEKAIYPFLKIHLGHHPTKTLIRHKNITAP